MSKRRVPLLTIKSITTALANNNNIKVWSSFSVRTKYLSTAAQRSDLYNSVDSSHYHFQNPNDYNYDNNNFDGNGLNPNLGFREPETTGNVIANNSKVSQFGNAQNSGDYQNFSNGSYRESWNTNYTQNVNQFQPRNFNYAGGVEMYHRSSAAPQYQQNLNLNGGQYASNMNGVPSVMEASHVSNKGNIEENPSESSSCIGTLEELDELCKEKKVKEAIEVLHALAERHVPVDLPRLLQLMRICGEAKASEEAKAVHDHLVRSLSPLAVSTCNKILDMYGKCGDMDNAFGVFNKMSERNLTSWDTMITWLAKNGLGEDALDFFSQFKQAGLVPDAKLFIGVFCACGVVGDANEGMLHFESMRTDYGIVPSMEHFVSIVDMLGTTGYLDEALEFIEKMPMEPSIDIWETLMNLSRIHGHLELGDRCAKLVELLDASRVNEQSKAGLVPVKVSYLTIEKEEKSGSQNLLEVRSRVHEYRAGDTSHPETDRIYTMLRGLRAQMKEHGYIPETRFVLHDIDQECKEDALLSHSERLAAAYGLITSPTRSPIRVIKNLRVCGDCHNALKIISKIVGRELIMRDAKRFHHFKNGVCSCRDYW